MIFLFYGDRKNPLNFVFSLLGWSKRLPNIFDQVYFTASVVTAFSHWKIGMPLLVRVVALIMKSTAQEFCDWAEPKGLIIDLKDKL